MRKYVLPAIFISYEFQLYKFPYNHGHKLCTLLLHLPEQHIWSRETILRQTYIHHKLKDWFSWVHHLKTTHVVLHTINARKMRNIILLNAFLRLSIVNRGKWL